MPIDLCSSVNSVSHYAFGSSALNSILSSSIFVAVVIALIMMALIMILYPAKKGTPFFLVGKMFVYMFFISWLVIFLHDSVLRYTFDEDKQKDSSHDFIHHMTNNDPVYGNYTPVQPTIAKTEYQPEPTPPPPPQPVPVKTNEVLGSSDIIGAGKLGGSHPPILGGNPFK